MTRDDIIHKLARVIDPLAFEADADPHRFADAIIKAESVIDIINIAIDQTIDGCIEEVRNCQPFMLENDAVGDGFREAIEAAIKALEALKKGNHNG